MPQNTLRVNRDKFLFRIDLYDDDTATDEYGKLATRETEENKEKKLKHEAYYNEYFDEFCTPQWLERHLRRHGIGLDQFFAFFELKQDSEWRIVNIISGKELTIRRHKTHGNILEVYSKRQGRFRILALDGGGLAGIFTARVLQKMMAQVTEKVVQESKKKNKEAKRIRDYLDATNDEHLTEAFNQAFPAFEETYLHGLQGNFLHNVDHIMGTSAGAVNAIILAQHDDPSDGVQQCVKVWREPKLFRNTLFNSAMAMWGLAPFMSHKNFREVLSHYIDPELRLKDLKKDVLITTFALDPVGPSPRWQPKIFNSFDPEDGEELALDVAIRACSAPILNSLHQGYVDGGVFSPSPTSHAISLFRAMTTENEREREQLGRIYKKFFEINNGHWVDAVGFYIGYLSLLRQIGLTGLDPRWENFDRRKAQEYIDNHLQKSHATLELLSIGTGTCNKRMILSDKKSYHWGVLQWSIPSHANNFLNLSALLFDANNERASTEMEQLSEAAHDLNFYRISPGVLTYDQFAYTYMATSPFFREYAITQLEKDANKMEVGLEVERAAQWLMDHWIGSPSLNSRLQKEGSTISFDPDRIAWLSSTEPSTFEKAESQT